MTEERTSCRGCGADFGHRPDCSRRLPEKPIGCPDCGLLGGHARAFAEALGVGRGLHALIPTVEPVDAYPIIPGPRPNLRALVPEEETPALAQQEIVDRVISALLAEDARARSCLPDPPAGWRWDASLDARSNGQAAQGEVRVRIAYRLVEDA